MQFKKATQLGRRTETATIKVRGSQNARVIIRHYVDTPHEKAGLDFVAGDITVRAIQGDGRTADFQVLIPEHTVASVEEATEVAQSYLDSLSF